MCNLLNKADTVGMATVQDMVKRMKVLELVIAELDTISTL